MRYWVMKSEPNEYSIDNLKEDKVGRWDGIRNYQVRNMLRDDMKKGDQALFYHSNAGAETGVVGIMEIVKAAYTDPSQFDKKSHYYDPKSDESNPRWLAVDVKYKGKLLRTVKLTELKENPKLAGLPLIKKGNRLSVVKLEKNHFDTIINMANK